MKNPRLSFGTSDSHVAFTTQVTLGIKIEDGMNYLVYDEMDFYTEFDMSIEQETFYGNIKQMRFTKGGDNKGRELPVWDDLEVSPAEYLQFWGWMDKKTDAVFRWLNNQVFKAGVQLPYWNLEFLTKFKFHERAMLAVIDLYYNTYEK